MKENEELGNVFINMKAERYPHGIEVFIDKPAIKEVLNYINTNSLLKQFEWIKEPGDTVIYTKAKKDANFPIAVFGFRDDILGASVAVTSFELLGQYIIETKYEQAPQEKDLKLKELEKICLEYLAGQQHFTPKRFALNECDGSNDGLKKLVEDMWGINTKYRIVGDEWCILSQRLDSNKINILAESCYFYDLDKKIEIQHKIITSRLKYYNGAQFERIGIPIDNLREAFKNAKEGFENRNESRAYVCEFTNQGAVLLPVNSLPETNVTYDNDLFYKNSKLSNDGKEESTERLPKYSSNKPTFSSMAARVENSRKSGTGVER